MRIARQLFLIAAMAAWPCAAVGQHIKTVGPPTNSPSSLFGMGYLSNWVYQSFVAPPNAVFLRSFSFWWSGTTLGPLDYVIFAGLGSSPDDPADMSDRSWTLDRYASGWQAIDYNMPVSGAEQLYFYLVVSNASSDECCDGQQLLDIRLTNSDAYPDGQLNGPTAPYDGRDMLFQADFQVTPEPVSLVLLGTGLLGLGGVARRRRRKLL